jgi:hypothetical protein
MAALADAGSRKTKKRSAPESTVMPIDRPSGAAVPSP